ncbi:MAG: pyrroline-5-carboxylate reductase [Verrucomicrobia bacterium]|nr:pyrroline-5-carboxylate reductase [Verrucomicrobiota bacterium]MBU6446331.1 pyrroline-5-carboxylate reductase [Verrucomicrobiota bacterium]MDE3047221.1 pyrroline-5-carboxylate reductase [Verrucomicrobiota bacterium]
MKISEMHLGFLGFGHMAQVIFQAIDHAKLIPRSQVSFIRRDPQKMRENEKTFGITSTSLERLLKTSDLIILGVRPHQAKEVLSQMKGMDPAKMVVTMLSGIHIATYRKYLKNPLVRVMPNTASEVGMGMSVFSYADAPSEVFRSLTHLLFSCMGEVIELPEAMMDISVGISGSGPGFVFRLIEAAAREGEKRGIPYKDALTMAAQTFMGAGKLVLKKGNVQNLLLQIATPNGTTEAGLKKMSELKIDEHYREVISAATKRSKELSEES